jgi:hypothetical protein
MDSEFSGSLILRINFLGRNWVQISQTSGITQIFSFWGGRLTLEARLRQD